MRPLVGLPGRRKKASQVEGFAPTWADVDVEVHLRDWARSVALAGGVPVQIPLDADPVELMARIDALVLTAGADIDPARYGADPDPDLGTVEPDRDDHELALLAAALERELPVLAVCRGHQLLNVARGGTLRQHDPSHQRFDLAPDALVHDVTFTPGSRLHDLYGPSIRVNTMHHQYIELVGEGLVVTGVAPDGVIEGIELPGADVVGVQWHPEVMAGDPSFRWVVERAGARMR